MDRKEEEFSENISFPVIVQGVGWRPRDGQGAVRPHSNGRDGLGWAQDPEACFSARLMPGQAVMSTAVPTSRPSASLAAGFSCWAQDSHAGHRMGYRRGSGNPGRSKHG